LAVERLVGRNIIGKIQALINDPEIVLFEQRRIRIALARENDVMHDTLRRVSACYVYSNETVACEQCAEQKSPPIGANLGGVLFHPRAIAVHPFLQKWLAVRPDASRVVEQAFLRLYECLGLAQRGRVQIR
jgi:hypothetical protein